MGSVISQQVTCNMTRNNQQHNIFVNTLKSFWEKHMEDFEWLKFPKAGGYFAVDD